MSPQVEPLEIQQIPTNEGVFLSARTESPSCSPNSARSLIPREEAVSSPIHMFLSPNNELGVASHSDSSNLGGWSDESTMVGDEDSVVAVGEYHHKPKRKGMESLKRQKGNTLNVLKELHSDDVEMLKQAKQNSTNQSNRCMLAVSKCLHGFSKLTGCLCCCLPERYRYLKFNISLLSVMAMTLNVFVLLAITALTATQYLYGSHVEVVDIVSSRATIISSYKNMRMSTRIAAFNNGSVGAEYPLIMYSNNKKVFTNSLAFLLTSIPFFSTTRYEYMHGSIDVEEIAHLEIFEFWEQAFNVTFGYSLTAESFELFNGTCTSELAGCENWLVIPNNTVLQHAQEFLASSEFTNAENQDATQLQDLLDGMKSLGVFSVEIMRYSNLTTLILLSLSIVLVIPAVLMIFGISLKESSSNQQQLQQAKVIMVLDTMNDSSMRRLFQTFCSASNQFNSCFNFLDEVRQYRELCQQSIQTQVELIEKSRDAVVSDKKPSIDNDQLKSIFKTEMTLKKLEVLKHDRVFDLMTEYFNNNADNRFLIDIASASQIEAIVMEIDAFNNKVGEFEEFDILPDDLFDRVEREVAEFLSATHNLFLQPKEGQAMNQQ